MIGLNARNFTKLQAKLALVLLSGTAFSAMAAAAPATDDGARGIENSLAIYLGKTAVEQKIISVKPQGDSYQITLDFEKAASNYKVPGFELKMPSLTILATEQADGNWAVKSESFPSLSVKIPNSDGGFEESIKYENYKFDGIFNPKLMAWMTGKAGHDSVSAVLGGKMVGTAKMGAGQFDMSGLEAGNGAVSGKMHQTLKDVVEIVQIPTPAKDGAPAGKSDFTFKISELSGDSDIDSAKNKAMWDLWAAFLANPTKEALAKNQADIKAKLTAAMPLWNNVKGSALLKDISVVTSLGSFGVKTFGESIGLSGLVEHGSFQFGLNFTDLTLPTGLVPAVNAPLVPTSMDIDIKITADGLDRMAKTMIDEADFATEKVLPESATMELMGMAMTANPKIVIAPSHIVAPSMNLTIAGEVATNGLNPVGKITIDAIGLDKTITALKEAGKNDPEAQKMVAGLSVARGMAKPGPNGASSFLVEINGKTVSVNGMAIPMGK